VPCLYMTEVSLDLIYLPNDEHSDSGRASADRAEGFLALAGSWAPMTTAPAAETQQSTHRPCGDGTIPGDRWIGAARAHREPMKHFVGPQQSRCSRANCQQLHRPAYVAKENIGRLSPRGGGATNACGDVWPRG
jgi:hypothetical protein